MKILHVVRQFLPAVGGMEVYVKDMIHHQKALGYECDVLTLNTIFQTDGGDLPHQEIIDNIKIHRVGFIGKRSYFIPFVSPLFFKDYDIVHVHNTDMFFDYVGLACWWHNVPAFATTHGGFFHTQKFAWIKKIYFQTITRLSSMHYKVLFASSTNDFELFQGKNKNLMLTPNAITPLGDFTAKGDDFIYIGRLAHHKQVDHLITTFAALVKSHNIKGKLHIVGPEWDVKRTDLWAQAESLHVKDRIEIHGFIDQHDMQSLLKKCGYFVSASAFEGFGMSMLEGMSVGLIPYVQPNGSFKDLIAQGGVGHCVDYTQPTDAAELIASKITETKADDRKKAREFANEFSWEELAAKTVKAYESL